MAKKAGTSKAVGMIRMLIAANEASPSLPLGPALGQVASYVLTGPRNLPTDLLCFVCIVLCLFPGLLLVYLCRMQLYSYRQLSYRQS